MLYCTRFFHNLPLTFEEGDFCCVYLRGRKGYVWLFGEHMWWLSFVCVCVCVCVFEGKERVRLALWRVCVCVGGGGEAVRTRAFLSSDGRIALLRPRWTDSVWESWKETTVCFLREMGLLQYTTLCCLSFAAFMKRAQWAAYLGSISWGICEQCVLQDLVFEEKVSIPPPPPPLSKPWN